jgi:polar amino acid transport system substrate-binding protein
VFRIIVDASGHRRREDRLRILGQRLSDGSVAVFDAPDPVLAPGFIRVSTLFSAVSSGTEGGKVIAGRMSLAGKARAKPAQAAQVLGMAGTLGLKATYMKVKSRLEGAAPLGYSLCGRIIETSAAGRDLRPGDLVACAGGGYANHADQAVVPSNLVVGVPPGVDPRAAAYTTIASISLQGVRLAEPTFGDSALVIGLGIVGQLACQFLRANGCRVFGVDTDPRQVELALGAGSIEQGAVPGRDPVEAMVDGFTRGRGTDMTLICAGTSGNQPVELAGAATRRKGRVAVVGAVGMNLPREVFYRKELRFTVSCSYGPGRYDPGYEEGGRDYPFPYVRWTEGRNMEAALDGMASGAVDPLKLTTHVFPLDSAPDAYGMIADRKKPFCGILIEYPETPGEAVRQIPLKAAARPVRPGRTGVGLAGPGSFAQTFLLPPLRKDRRVFLSAVATRSGLTAADAGARLGFRRAVGGMDDLVSDPETGAVIVATRHDTHGAAVAACLRAGKPVFVEKPLCLTMEELREIAALHRETGVMVQVGFNRRFSGAARAAAAHMGGCGPLTMLYRVNAGFVPRDHWTQSPEGGGRILGEVCHFTDLMQFITRADVERVHAMCVRTPDASMVPEDNVAVSLSFSDGSVGTVVYTAGGGKAMPKERFEVHGCGRSAVIDNFGRVETYTARGKTVRRFSGKGHSQEVAAFLDALETGVPAIPMESQILTTLAGFAILESLKTEAPVRLRPETI